MAIALAMLGSIGLGMVVTSAMGPTPTTVRSALGLDGADPPGLDRRRAEAVERVVAACMARQGFPYHPVADPGPAIPDAELDPIAWAERWGFGVSTAIGWTQAAPSLRDPNVALAERLGPAEAQRYRAALIGTEGQDGGCRAAGADTIHGLRQRLLAPLSQPLSALQAAIDRDPRTRTVRTAWVACIRRAADTIGIRAGDRTRDRLVPVALDVLARRLAALAPDDETGLARLQAAERRSAVSIARCESSYAAGRAAVAEPYEAAFVRAHRADLRRIGAAIRAAEAALPNLPAP